jgi:site-specific DNA-methyltransferase (cytosine-N4-specific)
LPISSDREVFVFTPGLIVPKTKRRLLKDVDLNFNGYSTQHSTHSLHPYVAAINPPLARQLIDTYVPENGKVLDPYCGGGGVLVESMLLGRECSGFDINPLAVMIAKAKTTRLEKAEIEKEYVRIGNRFHESRGRVQPYVSETALFWFNADTALDLAALGLAINEIENDKIKNLFQVILSYTARSVMLTYRGEVRLRKLVGKDLEKFSPNVISSFDKKYREALIEVPLIPEQPSVMIHHASVLNMPARDGEFHSVVCSPPYADDKNGVGYFQFSRYLLEWIGMTPEIINSYKRQFLGGDQDDKTLPPSSTLHILAGKMNDKKPGKFRELASFYADYYESLAEMKRVVTDWIIIVIGNRVLGRTNFDNAHITIELFEAVGGVKLIDYYSREITKKRIPNLGSDGGGINTEHILIFKKS